jgi:hypothetical protein
MASLALQGAFIVIQQARAELQRVAGDLGNAIEATPNG